MHCQWHAHWQVIHQREAEAFRKEDAIIKPQLDFYDGSVISLSHAKDASLPAVLLSSFHCFPFNRLLHFIQNSDHLRKQQKQKFRKGLNHLKNLNITSKDVQCIQELQTITCIFPQKNNSKNTTEQKVGVFHITGAKLLSKICYYFSWGPTELL